MSIELPPRAFNSISHEDYEDTNIIVHSDGRIFWIPPVTFHTSCDFGTLCYVHFIPLIIF